MCLWLIDLAIALACVNDKHTVKSILNRMIIKVRSGLSLVFGHDLLHDRFMADVISVTNQLETDLEH